MGAEVSEAKKGILSAIAFSYLILAEVGGVKGFLSSCLNCESGHLRQNTVFVTLVTPSKMSLTWSSVGSDCLLWAHKLRMSPKY